MAQYDAQEASIRRQQAIAKALRDSGNQGFDPAASAGRLVYARSPWEDVNKVFQQGTAAYLDNRAEKRTRELEDQKTSDARTRLGGMLDTLMGKSQNVLAQPNDPALSPLSGDTNVSNPITGQSATVGIGNEMNQKRAGLAAMLKGQDPQAAVAALEGPALQLALARPEKLDTGGQLVWRDPVTGEVTSRLDKSATKDAELGANVSMRGQNISREGNILDNQTAVRGQNVSAASSRYATDASTANNQLDNKTAVANAQLAAMTSRLNSEAAAAVDREKIAATKAGGKALTEFQAKAVGQLSRMEASEARLDKVYQPGMIDSMTATIPGLGNSGYVTSPEYQAYKQNAQQWISGVLRLDSGAAVPEEEFKRYFQTYFPQSGEDAAVVEQKKKAREDAMMGLRTSLKDVEDRVPPRPPDVPGSGGVPTATDGQGNVIEFRNGAWGPRGN